MAMNSIIKIAHDTKTSDTIQLPGATLLFCHVLICTSLESVGTTFTQDSLVREYITSTLAYRL